MRPIALALLVLPSLALAQSAPAEEPATSGAYVQKETHIDFDDMDVRAAALTPTISLTIERPKSQFNPMVQLRYDFNAEMAASVQELR